MLKVVVDGLHPGGYLRHAPVRTFFRIVSVAIILLKTFALGATEEDVAVSLGLLSDSVDALRTSIVDDVHVGNRFADLVETLSHRIRSRFVRLAANGGSTSISRGGSRSPIPAPMMPPPSSLGHNSAHLVSPYMGSGTTFQGTGTSVPGSPSLGLTASGRATPLWGISAEPYDPNSNSISIMPPPGDYSSLNTGSQTNGTSNPNQNNWTHWTNNSANWGGAQDQDWLALPLDPLLDQWGAEINQTAMGPDIGGMDMLDILLNMGGPPGSTA